MVSSDSYVRRQRFCSPGAETVVDGGFAQGTAIYSSSTTTAGSRMGPVAAGYLPRGTDAGIGVIDSRLEKVAGIARVPSSSQIASNRR